MQEIDETSSKTLSQQVLTVDGKMNLADGKGKKLWLGLKIGESYNSKT